MLRQALPDWEQRKARLERVEHLAATASVVVTHLTSLSNHAAAYIMSQLGAPKYEAKESYICIVEADKRMSQLHLVSIVFFLTWPSMNYILCAALPKISRARRQP